jgi:hypothetical protein
VLQSRRRRRYQSQVLPREHSSRVLKKVCTAVLLIAVVAWGVGKLFESITPASRGQRMATELTAEGRGRVEVTISGEGESQRAETGLRLYDGDRVDTDSASTAVLHFFDDSFIALNAESGVELGDVLKGEERSEVMLTLHKGKLWITAGGDKAISRVVSTPRNTLTIPPETKAIIGTGNDGDTLSVFASSGPGVEVAFRGQKLHLSSEQIAAIRGGALDPYEARSALDQAILSSELYVANAGRKVQEEPPVVASAEEPQGETTVDGELLVVDAPGDGAQIEGSAVVIKGRVGSRVANVKVNGYSAQLLSGSFEKEIALPGDEEFTVDVHAEDKDGLLIAEKSLALRHDIKPPDPPTIIEPGQAGSQVSVSLDSFEIVGSAPPDAAGVIVNGYRLQKFQQGKPWKYLVDPAIGNVRIGENAYEAVTVDRAGNRSEPVTITILWKAEPLPSPEDFTRPRDDGAFRAPGSLRVIAPTAGEPFETGTAEVVIEGETHPDTHSISINGFNLTKYLPSKTTWNYIARADFGNYHLGTNRYTVVARDGEGRILDVLQYVIEKQ